MITLKKEPEKRNAIFAALVLVILTIAILILRTGSVPAASGGDEVWWSESAYFLIQDGTLKWPMFASDAGFAEKSYWPPVLPIIQAGFFGIFGVNAIGMYAQSTLHCILVCILVAICTRIVGGNWTKSLLAGVSIFAAFSIERQLVQVRMESMTAACGLATIAATLYVTAKERSLQTEVAWGLFSGVALSVGLLSYYPLSPFLLLSIAVFYLQIKPSLRFLFITSIGATPISICFLLWIAGDWNRFKHQVLDAGGGYLKNDSFFSNLIPLTTDFSSVAQWEQTLSGVFAIVVLALTREKAIRGLAVCSLGNFLSEFAYNSCPQLLPTCISIILLFSMRDHGLTPFAIRLKRIVEYGLVLAAMVKVSLIGSTALVQREGRSYAYVKNSFDGIDFSGGGVAVSQRAWLALRPRLDSKRMHFLVYSGPSLLQASEVLKNKKDESIDFFDWLVLENDKTDTLERVYPWIKQGIDDGTYVIVARVRSPWKPLPWAKSECYDLTIYSKPKESVRP